MFERAAGMGEVSDVREVSPEWLASALAGGRHRRCSRRFGRQVCTRRGRGHRARHRGKPSAGAAGRFRAGRVRRSTYLERPARAAGRRRRLDVVRANARAGGLNGGTGRRGHSRASASIWWKVLDWSCRPEVPHERQSTLATAGAPLRPPRGPDRRRHLAGLDPHGLRWRRAGSAWAIPAWPGAGWRLLLARGSGGPSAWASRCWCWWSRTAGRPGGAKDRRSASC